MKINSINPMDAISKYKVNSTNTKKQPEKIQRNDKLELSEEAKIYLSATKAAKDAGEVRSEKVARLKKLVESGNYKVDSKDVAKSILNDSKKIRP